jgi:hypothetical protein
VLLIPTGSATMILGPGRKRFVDQRNRDMTTAPPDVAGSPGYDLPEVAGLLGDEPLSVELRESLCLIDDGYINSDATAPPNAV